MDWSSLIYQIYSVTLSLFFPLLIVGVIWVIVMGNRNPVKTVAWVLVLIFLPMVGLVLYWFFGGSRRRERVIESRIYNKLYKRPMAEYEAKEETPYLPKCDALIGLFKRTNQAFPFSGNSVCLQRDGYAAAAELLSAIGKAHHHIHLLYYIIENDSWGRLLRDMLIDKARSGVEVRLIYDDVGCLKVRNRFFESMQNVGIEVRSFLPVRFPKLTGKVNYRNHRKIVVVDGRVGFVGGMNIAKRYLQGTPKGVWRDSHLRIEGKAVHGLQTAFLSDWYFADQSLMTGEQYFPEIEDCGSSVVQIVTSDPIGPWKEIMQGMVKAISSATRYVYMQTPYFLPTEPVLSAMQTAALSGVDVRLMIPQYSDSGLVHLGSRSYVSELLDAGVGVYFYRAGFLHSKLMVIDDLLFTVGTTNLDVRSFEHNFEVNAFVYDAALTVQAKESFLTDQRKSVRLTAAKWNRRPKAVKVLESIVRLFSPIL